MDDDLFTREIRGEAPKRDNLFAWTVLILLLTGFAFACWIGSYYLFGHPENPRSYRILKKLHKIEAPKRFELTAAPPGEFLSPQKLFDRYIKLSPIALQNENNELMRNYIGNYQTTKKLVPYVIGRFSILDTFELKSSDLFESGVVALAQAEEFPQVLIEHVYTADKKNVPALRKMLTTGLDLKLERTLDLAAVVHVGRLNDGRLQFTVVPLLYGSYTLKQGSGIFSLEPPADLNLDAGAPIVRAEMLQEATKNYAGYRKKASPQPGYAAAPTPSATPAVSELVRVETPEPMATPSPTPATAMVKPTPAPAGGPSPKPVATPTPAMVAVATPTPKSIAAETPRPTPRATPTPAIAQATPAKTVSSEGVPLQPFLVAAPTPNVASSGGSWRVYPPGQMPRGRLVDVKEVNDLATRGVGGERIYLRGNFVVTASGDNTAVLRAPSGLLGALGRGSGGTRVFVNFPSGAKPPAEGSSVERDEMRPFQITDVRKGADGQVTVYVREVTQ